MKEARCVIVHLGRELPFSQTLALSEALREAQTMFIEWYHEFGRGKDDETLRRECDVCVFVLEGPEGVAPGKVDLPVRAWVEQFEKEKKEAKAQADDAERDYQRFRELYPKYIDRLTREMKT